MTGFIVAAIDGSEPATAALEWAADEAGRRGAALEIVHVREPWAGEYPFHRVAGFGESRTGSCEGVLDRAAERARERAPGLAVTTVLTDGTVIERLTAEAADADLLVVGSRGVGGFTGLVLGSVGLGLAARATVPLVVVRGTWRDPRGEVVVGVDGSPHSDAALAFAVLEARLRGCRLRAVHAWPPPHGPALAGRPPVTGSVPNDVSKATVAAFQRRLAPWRDRNPDVELAESAVCGHPIAVLIDASWSADLVVVGSRGRGEVKGALLGSVSHGILQRAHCPVAIVRRGTFSP